MVYTDTVMEISFSFDLFFQTAPPTIVLMPDIPTFTIITANEAYLNATGSKLEDLVGKGFLDAFPENPSDPFTKNVQALRDSMTRAVQTRQQDVMQSQKYDIPIWGTDKFNTHYWRATNSPIINQEGEVFCIVHVTLDITSAVEAAQKERFAFEVAEARRKATEQIEERLRLAIDSAQLGTWHIDVQTRAFITSPRFKELYGYYPDDDLSYDAAIACIQKEHRPQVIEGVEAAITQHKAYNLEYPVVGFHDRKLRWVRATGRRYDEEGSVAANFSGTIMDVTEQKLEELRKNDFLSIASHELKTPLTSLKGNLQLLSKLKQTPAAPLLPKLIDQANKSLDKISALVNDLLNVSRITEGKIKLNLSVFKMAELVEGCCEHVTGSGTHSIILDGDTDLTVQADKQRTEQVVVNFVNNAVKYAPNSDRIIISLVRTVQMAKIAVQDFGPGIPKNHQTQLFDRYYRVDATSIRNSGLGLGLYISAEIVKMHGGEIGVDSEPGKGSTFWFTIPLAEVR
jgi:PAS domain S-box-containing protein